MKIAFLTHEPFDPPSGGGSAEAGYLVTELVQRGHEVYLFAPQPQDPPPLLARRHGIAAIEERYGIRVYPFRHWRMGRYTRLKSLKYYLYPFALNRLVRRAAQQVGFDLIFAQHTISAVAAGLLRPSLRIPVVMNYLDFLTAFLETWPWFLAPRWMVRRLKAYEITLPQRSQADGVLTVSDPLADRIAATGYPQERILPIYYGFDSNFFYPDRSIDDKNPSEDPSRPFKIVMHGSFDHHHLGQIAIDTIRHVVERYPRAEFHFVGPHSRAVRRVFHQLRDLVLEGNLHCTGFAPYSYVPRILRDARVGLVPYESSQGVHCAFVAKTVEYLALGIPVVSTPLEGIRRYFHDEPFIRFGDFSGESLAREIFEWLEMPPSERQTLAESAHRRVKEQLEWRTIAKKAVDFVEATAHHRTRTEKA